MNAPIKLLIKKKGKKHSHQVVDSRLLFCLIIFIVKLHGNKNLENRWEVLIVATIGLQVWDTHFTYKRQEQNKKGKTRKKGKEQKKKN